jgi:mannitol/fructose-specific phosphotransferase system IIA component (Ntr-type)
MKITDFIKSKAIIIELKAKTKKGVIIELVKRLKKTYPSVRFSTNMIANILLEREKIGSTGVGRGVAVPHAKTDLVRETIGVFGRSKTGVDFNAIDGEPVYLFFLILSSQEKQDHYHKALKTIMEAIKNRNFCNFLKNARSIKEVEEIFKEAGEIVKV